MIEPKKIRCQREGREFESRFPLQKLNLQGTILNIERYHGRYQELGGGS